MLLMRPDTAPIAEIVAHAHLLRTSPYKSSSIFSRTSSGSSIDVASLIGGNMLVGGRMLATETAKFVGELPRSSQEFCIGPHRRVSQLSLCSGLCFIRLSKKIVEFVLLSASGQESRIDRV